MAVTPVSSEDRSVQATFAKHPQRRLDVPIMRRFSGLAYNTGREVRCLKHSKHRLIRVGNLLLPRLMNGGISV